LAGVDDQEAVGIPFAIDPVLHEAEVAFDFLEFPAALGADCSDLLVELEGFSEFEVDENTVGVILGPLVHDFEEVLGVILAEFFNPLLVSRVGGGGIARAGELKGGVSWRGSVAAAAEAFEPAGGVEVRGRKVPGEILVPATGAEEEGDAVVGAGDNERGVTSVEALDDISAEGVTDE
jgi:hypothetical protein